MTESVSPPMGDSRALDDLRAQILAIPTENISNIAKQAFNKTDIIPLWFGEGDIGTPDFICAAAARAVTEGHTFYTYQNGIPELRAALSAYLTRLNRKPVPANRITVTSGGMPAIQLAIQAVLNDGDNVIIIDPVWPNITGITRIQGGEARSVPLTLSDKGWVLDIERVTAAIDERTKALFFASPGNPTGAMLPVEDQKTLLDLARKHGFWIISDEVYSRMDFTRDVVPSFLDIAEPEDRVLIVNSFSKSWAMTGWRLGWLVHPPSLEETLAMMVQYTSSGTTTFLQHAAVTAIRDGEDFVREMRDYSRNGMEIVCDVLERIPRVQLRHRPGAGMYAFFQIDGMEDSRAACLEILEKTQVGLAPGYFFGENFNSFVRLCFCRSPAQLRKAMERLEGALQ